MKPRYFLLSVAILAQLAVLCAIHDRLRPEEMGGFVATGAMLTSMVAWGTWRARRIREIRKGRVSNCG